MKLKIKKGLIASAACLATSIGASLAMSANAPVFAGSMPSNCSDIKPVEHILKCDCVVSVKPFV